MDFLSILTTFGDKGFEWVGIGLLVWCIVFYLPKRDHNFLNELKDLREGLVEAEDKAHDDIVAMIHDHDKRAIECSANIAQILKEMQSINMRLNKE